MVTPGAEVNHGEVSLVSVGMWGGGFDEGGDRSLAHKGREGAMEALQFHICMEAATVARILAY